MPSSSSRISHTAAVIFSQSDADAAPNRLTATYAPFSSFFAREIERVPLGEPHHEVALGLVQKGDRPPQLGLDGFPLLFVERLRQFAIDIRHTSLLF